MATTEFVFSLGSLYDYLTKLTDRRKRRGVRYSLATILVLAILAKLCGQDKPSGIADWAQQRRSLLIEALRLKRGQLPQDVLRAGRVRKSPSPVGSATAESPGDLRLERGARAHRAPS